MGFFCLACSGSVSDGVLLGEGSMDDTGNILASEKAFEALPDFLHKPP
jgi:hypothetical protein